MNETKEQAKQILESCINIRGTITLGNYTEISVPYKDALASTLKALEAAEPEWISVEDDLPEKQKDVLVAKAKIKAVAMHVPKFTIECHDGYEGDRQYDEITHKYYWLEGWYEWNEYYEEYYYITGITHWMYLQPLPSLPKQ